MRVYYYSYTMQSSLFIHFIPFNLVIWRENTLLYHPYNYIQSAVHLRYLRNEWDNDKPVKKLVYYLPLSFLFFILFLFFIFYLFFIFIFYFIFYLFFILIFYFNFLF